MPRAMAKFDEIKANEQIATSNGLFGKDLLIIMPRNLRRFVAIKSYYLNC